MAKRDRKKGSLKRVSSANLKKLLHAESKEDLVKMVLAMGGAKVTKRGGKKRGRPSKHGRGSYARVAKRDARGRILPASGRGPGRPKGNKSSHDGRGSWAQNPAHRYKSGPKKGKLMSKAAYARQGKGRRGKK
jgi:hypothetical protein